MPGREFPLVTGEIYHVFNRGITQHSTFPENRDCERALATIGYYRHLNHPRRYSFFMRQSKDEIEKFLSRPLVNSNSRINLLAYCLMPNHFHFLIRQSSENGISSFVSLFTNSYTRYFNTKRRRHGSLFQGRFKAVRIESEEQLIHVSRYIHLNPYSSNIVKIKSDLANYPYSSYRSYIELSQSGLCDKNLVMDLFPNAASYQKFVLDQSDYQRQLEFIKHLIIDDP